MEEGEGETRAAEDVSQTLPPALLGVRAPADAARPRLSLRAPDQTLAGCCFSSRGSRWWPPSSKGRSAAAQSAEQYSTAAPLLLSRWTYMEPMLSPLLEWIGLPSGWTVLEDTYTWPVCAVCPRRSRACDTCAVGDPGRGPCPHGTSGGRRARWRWRMRRAWGPPHAQCTRCASG